LGVGLARFLNVYIVTRKGRIFNFFAWIALDYLTLKRKKKKGEVAISVHIKESNQIL
jgi:hypothetical protein